MGENQKSTGRSYNRGASHQMALWVLLQSPRATVDAFRAQFPGASTSVAPLLVEVGLLTSADHSGTTAAEVASLRRMAEAPPQVVKVSAEAVKAAKKRAPKKAAKKPAGKRGKS